MLETALSQTLALHKHARRWWIAFSGGSDSTALLHLAASLPVEQRPPITAIHIHHGLSENADAWAGHCEMVCADLNIGCIVVHVAVARSGNIEETARNARYQVFGRLLAAEEVLMMAHHQADQAETLLFRLLRGGGVKGLSAIPQQRPLGGGVLVRPLLNMSKPDIDHYLQQHKLAYIDDESNNNLIFDRNYLRLKVMPSLAQRWPRFERQFLRTQRHMLEANQLLGELAEIDLKTANASLHNRHFQWCLPYSPLAITALKQLSQARLKNGLQAYFAAVPLVLSEQQLQQIVQQCVDADRLGQKPFVAVGGYAVRVVAGCLVVEPNRDVSLPASFDERLYEGRFELSDGVELTVSHDAHGALRAAKNYRLAPVLQSTRFKPHWRSHSTTLKKLMQECKLPYWHRPLLFGVWCGNELAAVQGIGVATNFLTPEVEFGFMLNLRVGGFDYLCP